MKPFVVLAAALAVTACAADTRTTSTSSSAARPPQATAPQPSAEVRDAQTRLRTLGMYDGPVDGLRGPETQAAVRRFQQAQGLPVTGQIDGTTTAEIRRAESAPISLSDRTAVRSIQNRLRQLNFYSGPADGVWGPSTQAALENFQRTRGLPVGNVTRGTVTAMGLDASAFRQNPPPATTATVPRDSLDPAVVRGVQQRLRQYGFYSGAADGIWGQRTQTALERFQRSRGLESTGQLNPVTASALGMDPNNLSASVPTTR